MMEQQNNTAVMMIEFGVSRQPESYQNVRCTVTLPVFVQPGDNVAEVLQEQMQLVKAVVRAQVDDEYERGYDKAAVYSTEPRFTALLAREAKVLVIAPAHLVEEMPEPWERECRKEYRGHRLGHILAASAREYPRFTVVDCTDGDWGDLPPLEPLTVWKYRPVDEKKEKRFWVLVKRGVDFNRKDYAGWWNYDEYFRVDSAAFWVEQAEQAARDGATLFPCTDGVFDTLPQPVKPEPKEEPEEEEWEDTDDGDN